MSPAEWSAGAGPGGRHLRRRAEPPLAAPGRAARGRPPGRHRRARAPARSRVPVSGRGGDRRRDRDRRERRRRLRRRHHPPDPGAGGAPVVAGPGRPRALAGDAGGVRATEPPGPPRAGLRGRSGAGEGDRQRFAGRQPRDTRADRPDRGRGLHRRARPGRLLRPAARQLGLRPEGADARRRAHGPARHLPGHHPAARLGPGARRRHDRCCGSPPVTRSWATGGNRSGACPMRPAPRSRCRPTRSTWT